MEPISIITAAVLSQFQVSALMGSIVGGIVGNRADSILCKSAKVIYTQLKNKGGSPVNHDIQRSVRYSYLKATVMAVEEIKSQHGFLEKYRNKEASTISRIHGYLIKELKKLNNAEYQFPENDVDERYSYLLGDLGLSSTETKELIVKKFKASVYSELKNNGFELPDDFRNNINTGWNHKGEEIDWFELTCAFFAEELKTNERLSSIIEVEYLIQINNKVENVNLKSDKIIESLAHLNDGYKSIIEYSKTILDSVNRIETKIENIDEKLDKFQSALLSKIEEIPAVIQNNPVTSNREEDNPEDEKTVECDEVSDALDRFEKYTTQFGALDKNIAELLNSNQLSEEMKSPLQIIRGVKNHSTLEYEMAELKLMQVNQEGNLFYQKLIRLSEKLDKAMEGITQVLRDLIFLFPKIKDKQEFIDLFPDLVFDFRGRFEANAVIMKNVANGMRTSVMDILWPEQYTFHSQQEADLKSVYHNLFGLFSKLGHSYQERSIPLIQIEKEIASL